MSLEPCNPDIFKNGIEIFKTNTISSENLEKWVKIIAQESGQPVDWHWAAGRALILALGDLDKVVKAIKNNRQIHDAYYKEAALQYLSSEELIERHINGIWAYNGL